ncbi:PAS domain-containing protein [Streptomyces zingiberis]|uniref:PAS domain-containing protein n=1 Tax=Streptomyces zingiberis TaxID=2053010 RepID=A0ABX1BN55_9ACTN|nr:PAS domain-containing protein [Streptomyces zingiberis]NJP99161.1 PAS domain-containing protein [Streptomyces zingiberis]
MSSRPSRGAARLAAILDALPDALLLVNCNGTVVNANTIALEAFEAPGTALVGRGLLDLLPSFDSKRIPGSMRLPDDDDQDENGRTKPTRMVARRTDGSEFPVEVTSANLDGRTPYASAVDAAFADHNPYTGDELLMLVVRDLTGTLDTEAELARQQRQTEMILRAAAEGVVGVDIEGRVVLVNPAAAQILGYRASDLGGKKLHPLIHHSRPDGSPLPYEETQLADTLRSGLKHRIRGQVLWAKDGRPVPVDMTTAPVRDGEQLVGAVLAFTDRRPYDALAARHSQLLAVLDDSLRGPLENLRSELGGLAADPGGQLWPEANQILHHLAAGYSRMTTLVDNVLSYQRLDSGTEKLRREPVPMDAVVAAGVEGAIELIGPGRAQFAVHAPAIEAEVDADRLATALAHLIADVAGVDSTGNTMAGGGSGDSTIVVAAAQRGEVVRIEVRGPYTAADPVHGPIVAGIVRLHGGVLQTHEVPGVDGTAYLLEVPVSAANVPVRPSGDADRDRGGDTSTTVMPAPAAPARGTPAAGGAAAPAGLPPADAPGDTPGAGAGAGAPGPAAPPAALPGAPAAQSAAAGDGPGLVHVPSGAGGARQGRPVRREIGSGPQAQAPGAQPSAQAPARGRQSGSRALPALPPAGTAAGRPDRPAPGLRPVAPEQPGVPGLPAGDPAPTGRRRGRPSPAEEQPAATHQPPRPQEFPGQQARPPQPAQPGRSGQAAQPGQPGRPAQGVAPSPAARHGGPDTPGPRPERPALPPAPSPAPPGGRPYPRPGAPEDGPAPRRAAVATAPAEWPAPQQATDEDGGGHPYGPQPPGAQPRPPEQPQGEGAPTGRRARALPAPAGEPGDGPPAGDGWGTRQGASGLPAVPGPARPQDAPAGGTPPEGVPGGPGRQPAGRRTRRALAPADRPIPEQPQDRQPPAQGPRRPVPPQGRPGGAPAEAAPQRQAFALPPAEADRAPAASGGGPSRPQPYPPEGARPYPDDPPAAAPRPPGPYGAAPAPYEREAHGRHRPEQEEDHTPPQPHPAPGGGRRARPAPPGGATGQQQAWTDGPPPASPYEQPSAPEAGPGRPATGRRAQPPQPAQPAQLSRPPQPAQPPRQPGPQPVPARAPQPPAGQPGDPGVAAVPAAPGQAPRPGALPPRQQPAPQPGPRPGPQPPRQPGGAQPGPQPVPAPQESDTHGHPISVRTLGQGVPFAQHFADQGGRPAQPQQTPPRQPAQPPDAAEPPQQQPAQPTGRRRKLAPPPDGAPTPGAPGPSVPRGTQPPRLLDSQGDGRAYAIGAPQEGTEGPEPLDGPNGAVDVTDVQAGPPLDDELPPEPLDNPRRLLVWPVPDVDTQQALSDRGYRPVIVNSREEVDAQIAAYPAALFVDPLTGPITRTALQSLRSAAVAAEVPVLVTAGLGQATREAAYGADPAVLFKALAPRDSEQHPPRVLLIEERDAVASALTGALERRGMQVARARSDADAVTPAAQMRPNLVVMDLTQVRRRRAGIVDWLRTNGLLSRTPLVVYTSAGIDPAEMHLLASGETVLYLAERSTSPEVQERIVDLLAKIGAT